jgi:hypothetical protein
VSLCIAGSHAAQTGFQFPILAMVSQARAPAVHNRFEKIKETLSSASPWVFRLVVVYKMSNYALPALNPACSICSRAASAVEWTPCTLSLKSSGLLAFSKAVS